MRYAADAGFDLLEQDGDDLLDLPLHERKQRVARLLGRTKWQKSSLLSI